MGITRNLENEKERRERYEARAIEPRKALRFQIHIVEHCNLNCKHCFHFSPLAKEEYLALEEFERDMARMGELFGEKAENIQLLGGEPLLHPEIEKLATGYKVPISYFNSDEDTKILVHEPIDIHGKQDAIRNFYECYRSNLCITLSHGILYTCLIPAYIHFLKEYFDLDIELSDKNGINIYQAESADEIFEFLTQPIPMCAYCDRKHITMGMRGRSAIKA